jgi:protein SCO1/2
MSLRAAWLALLLLALLLAGCAADHEFNGTLYNPAIDAPELVGIDQEGNPFRLSDLEGRVTLIFFGYTFCPDICPTTMGLMKRVAADLGTRADELAVVFVTIDPERDTPEQLNAYMGAFNEAFIGVNLDEAALEQAKVDFGVYAEKRVLDASQSSAGYLMDHTGWIYVIDEQGQMREVFGTDASAEAILEDVRFLMGRS